MSGVVGAPKEGMVKPQLTGREKVRATLGRMRPGREHLVDALFTLAVVACALVGLRTALFGWEWIRAAAVGAVLGLVVGHVQATYRWPLVATTAFGAVLYLVVGALVAVRDDIRWYVVPTGQTFKDLALAPVQGWKGMLTLVPPVDARGQYVAIALLVALVGTTLTYATARVTRSHLRLVLAPLALLAVTITLGTEETAGRWVQGLLLGGLLLLWCVERAQRGVDRVGGGRPALTRLLGGALILALAAGVAALVAPALPGVDGPDDRRVLRTEVVPGYDRTVFPSPLSGYREYTQGSPTGWYDQQLFQVDGVPATTPMRLATLDTWDGREWGVLGRSGTQEDAARSFQQIGRRVGVAETAGEPSRMSVTVPEDGYTGRLMLTSGEIQGIEVESEEMREQVWLNLSTNSMLHPPRLDPGDSYRLRTALPATASGIIPDDLQVASGALPMGADLDFVNGRINHWAPDASASPWSRFVAVARGMKEEGRYSDGTTAVSADGTLTDAQRVQRYRSGSRYPAGHGRGRLDDFLNSTPLVGNDEQYAASLALIGNQLGIPTRVVLGAVQTEDGIIRGRNVHAWVEVRTQAGDWYPIVSQNFVPTAEQTPPAAGTQAWQAPDTQAPPQPPPPPPPAPEPAVDWGDPTSWPLWAQLLGLLVLVPLLLVVLVPAAAALRRALRWRRGSGDRRVGRAWADLVEEARGLGRTMPAGGTRVEQALALGPQVDAVPAAIAADALVFAEGEVAAERVTAWQRELRAVRRRMRRAAPVRTRLRATVDPRPLLSRRVDVGLDDPTRTSSPDPAPRKATR